MKKMGSINIDDIQQGLGERFRKERNRLGLTQLELAEKLGIVTLSISHYETGKGYPSLKLLYQCHAAKMDILYIFLNIRSKDIKDSGLKKILENLPEDDDNLKKKHNVYLNQNEFSLFEQLQPVLQNILDHQKDEKPK